MKSTRPFSELQAEAQRIKQIVAAHFEIPVKKLDTHCRAPRIVWPRQIAIYLCSAIIPGIYQSDIARCFGKPAFSRPTITFACESVRHRVATEQPTKDLVAKFTAQIGGVA